MTKPDNEAYDGPRLNKESKKDDATGNQPASSATDVPQVDNKDREINSRKVNGPLVVLVGPGNCGKTVALIRLLKYLETSRKATWTCKEDFMNDVTYKKATKSFKNAVSDTMYNPFRTTEMNYLLLEIKKRGSFYCQIIEAPGEHYFSEDKEKADRKTFEPYQYQILQDSDYRKIYVFFFEQGMLSGAMEEKYSARLCQFAQMARPGKDRIILLYNKVDERDDVHNGPKVVKKTLLNEILKDHAGLMSEIDNNGDNLLFLPFSGGHFTLSDELAKKEGTDQENLRWSHSNDKYPSELWKHIEAAIENNDRPWGFFR